MYSAFDVFFLAAFGSLSVQLRQVDLEQYLKTSHRHRLLIEYYSRTV